MRVPFPREPSAELVELIQRDPAKPTCGPPVGRAACPVDTAQLVAWLGLVKLESGGLSRSLLGAERGLRLRVAPGSGPHCGPGSALAHWLPVACPMPLSGTVACVASGYPEYPGIREYVRTPAAFILSDSSTWLLSLMTCVLSDATWHAAATAKACAAIWHNVRLATETTWPPKNRFLLKRSHFGGV